MSSPIRLGLVGVGKIARDQHLPAIKKHPGLALVATASRNASLADLPSYRDVHALIEGEPTLDAIVLCQPPQVRYDAARTALLAGKHVFLEKPPGMTIGEVEALISLATAQGRTLYASWHSRHAAGVGLARAWLRERTVERIAIEWKEDVRHWHPGQPWIWQPGGFGVFDPGINALSILTEILPVPIRVLAARLEIPANRQAPIAAELDMATPDGRPIGATFDWRQTGEQVWTIMVEAAGSRLELSHGGNLLAIDGIKAVLPDEAEYPTMYAEFAQLIGAGRSDVDLAPLKIVADAFLCGQSLPTIDFHD